MLLFLIPAAAVLAGVVPRIYWAESTASKVLTEASERRQLDSTYAIMTSQLRSVQSGVIVLAPESSVIIHVE